ncbi:CLUMA_CG010368, isoform A [Clunio marinus]|uniref:CLUMA_CG010368, isoform A n=1 Tax=Clunio marinus TaxID=568069 RepID=A0A1J1IDG3_9DIPT|nr:CLUMA_CG010368, isoform A [Clunio marinus]
MRKWKEDCDGNPRNKRSLKVKDKLRMISRAHVFCEKEFLSNVDEDDSCDSQVTKRQISSNFCFNDIRDVII